MSVNSESSRIQYAGDGLVTSFEVPFYFFDASDLKVIVTDSEGTDVLLVLGVGYTVAGAGDIDGGQIITAEAWSNAHTITIYREVAATQPLVYVENAEFPAASHERGLDRATFLVQQALRLIGQSIRVRESDLALDVLAAAPSSLVAFDANKQPRTMTAAELAVWLNLTQQFFGQGTKSFLDAGDRASAVPDFLGQLGAQLDTKALYVSTGLSVGAWTPSVDVPLSITTAALAPNILTADLAGLGKMADGYLAASAEGRGKMANQYVTLAKLQNIATARLLGRATAGSGTPEEIALASSLSLSGGSLAVTNPASVLQTVYAESSAATVITTPNMVADNTIPQAGEGTQIFAQAFTPTSASSKVLVRFSTRGQVALGGNPVICALFRDSGVDAITATLFTPYAADYSELFELEFLDAPATASTITYKLRIGPTGGTTLTLNSALGSGQKLGGVQKSVFLLQEIKG